MPSTSLDYLELASAERAPDLAVIWLHGLGADGHDFVPIVRELGLPPQLAVRFVFPHAPMRPVTINMGATMRAWYDIAGTSLDQKQDEAGIRDSAARVEELIAAEKAAGLPAERILLAGFSQGGAIALHTALRHPEPLAGLLALSCYLPLHDKLSAEASAANRGIPIFQCHGVYDPMIPIKLAELSRDWLRDAGYALSWRQYPMQHEVCREQIADIRDWLLARAPQ